MVKKRKKRLVVICGGNPEDVDPNEQIISACTDIAEAGYSLALDDFVFKSEMQPT